MFDEPTINHVLYLHLFRGGGVAHRLRLFGKPYGYLEAVRKFFSATSDHERLVASHNLSTIILRLNNMEYMIEPREIVRRLEIERLLGYEKQQDHTIHSIYLYVLGIWIFDNSPIFRREYVRFYGHSNSDMFEEFQFDWLFSGLLHDIGYLLENLSSETAFGRKNLDNMFSATLESLAGHFPNVSDKEVFRSLQNSISKQIFIWSDENKLPRYEKKRSPSAVLIELRKAPWLPQLYELSTRRTSVIFSDVLFKQCSLWSPRTKELIGQLHAYAKHVSKFGYSPKLTRGLGVVDHAYASGCLQLQLTSFRYWLVSMAQEGIQDQLTDGKSYELENLQSIVNASLATALHNVLPINSSVKKIVPFRIQDSPLLFLSILVDELQKWHRFPSGKKLTRKISSYEYVNENELYLEIRTVNGEHIPCFGFNSNSRYKRLRKAIYARLYQEDLNEFFYFVGQNVNPIDDLIDEILKNDAFK